MRRLIRRTGVEAWKIESAISIAEEDINVCEEVVVGGLWRLTFSSAAFDRRARSDRGWYAADRARLSNVRCNGWLGLGVQACAGGAWKFHQDGAVLLDWWVPRTGVAGLSCMLGS